MCEKDDEIKIQVNNTKLLFRLKEFVIISGLKCTVNYNNDFDLSWSSHLMELYFPGKSKVINLDIENCFMEKK